MAQICQPGDLGVDLGQTSTQQIRGGIARALPGVAERKQVGDVGQPQAEALGAPDELEPVDRALVVAAVVSGGANEQALAVLRNARNALERSPR
jgi:hypothetical protein